MNKPKLLYASPFPPQKSGISDYSTVLVKALAELFDITLYTDNYEINDKTLKVFPVVKHGVDKIDFDKYSYKIYNIGNNPEFHKYIYEAALQHPGMVILHDMVLYYLFVGYYQNRGSLYSNLYYNCGLEDFLLIKEAVKRDGTSLLEQKHMAAKVELNEELLKSQNLIMVHSEYARNKILTKGMIQEDRVKHINLIEQVDKDSVLINREKLFRKYHVPQDALIISSFGYIADTKLNREVCLAVKEIAGNIDKKICYVMVGQGDYADDLLEKDLIIKTGYTELDEFNSFVNYSDIIVNLRYPSMGETSAAMLRILQMGKPCITNNGGWFSELPDDCVCKIRLDSVQKNVEQVLRELISSEHLCNSIGKKAQKYIEAEFSSNVITQQIYSFIREKDGRKNVFNK